jgi:hypothetical protein
MKDDIFIALAVLRFIPLVVLTVYSAKAKDRVALLIAGLWAVALVAGSFLHRQELSQVVASPLVVLVVWYIVRSQRR